MDTNVTSIKEESSWKFWKRRRHVVAAFAFFGFFNVYSLRVNLSVGIVAMTSMHNVTNGNNSFQQIREFDWDSKTQGLVLSSFFYGYICTQIVGGWLGTRYGGVKVYGLGVFVTALLTIFTPPIAKTSIYLLIALRVVEGLFEGVTYPCMHTVWSKWAPLSERSRLTAFAYSGSYFGTVVALPVCGILAEHFGWQSIFYITGTTGVIWCILWWVIIKETPENDPYISSEELQLLKDNIGCFAIRKIKHPWKEILTSVPVWAIIVAHFCENWGFYTLLTQLPTFMKDTLNYDLQKAGFLSSAPYLVMAIIMQFAGYLADWLCNKKIMSRTNVRKFCNSCGFLSQTIFMMLAAYLLTPTAVIICLVFAVGLGAFSWPAFGVNHLDIAPQHAGVLMGLSNTFGTLPGMISPILSGFLVPNKTADEWKIVFYLSGGIYLVGAVFYAVFASAERQPWSLEKEIPETQTNNATYTNQAMSIES